MTKTTIELLRKAREWLSVEEHWCARQFTNEKGANCAIGALARCGLSMPDVQSGSIQRLATAAMILDTTLEGFHPGAAIACFNDTGGWRPTLKMFDLAIKLEQEDMDRQAKELVESCSAPAQSASVGEAVAR